ncbi:MAG TPA: glycosyltransferase family 61 protein [Gemmatimonadaceae bacterium]|nr:glycosyltransferase family 61 protein [Gemmatimonadaceae bacterium]
MFAALRYVRWLSRVAYRAVRKPLVRGLRSLPPYRSLARLPRNDVASPRDAAAASAGGAYVVVHPPTRVELVAAGERAPEPFARATSFALPETFVAELRDARLFGRGVAVTTADGRTVSDVTVHLNGALEDHSVMRRFALPAPRRVDGTTAVLSAPGGNTYYHWLFDVLPRLELLRLAGHDLARVDRFAVNSTRYAFQRETLARFGIGVDRVLASDQQVHVECERMLLPSFPGPSGFPPRWVCDFLVRSLLPADADGAGTATPERVYVSRQRSAKRRVANADAVEEVLGRHGFTTVYLEDHDVATQARLFRRARVVVGVHGSGFSNVVFCHAGATLIEILHPAETPSHFWVLSRQVGVAYRPLVAARAPEPRAHLDVVVDVDALEEQVSGTR